MHLQTRAVSKYYQSTNTRALSEVSISFQPGTIHFILGENGAGKSTFAKILTGGIIPTSGSILSPPGEKLPGFLPQHSPLFSSLNLEENLNLHFKGRATARCRTEETRNQFLFPRRFFPESAESIMHIPADRLPEGSRSFLLLLSLLARDPGYIVLDEPTAALTSSEVEEFYSILKKYRDKGKGKGIIIISHRIQEVLDHGDIVSVLRRGSLAGTAPVDTLDHNTIISMMIGEGSTSLKSGKPTATEPGKEDVNASGKEKKGDIVFSLRNLSTPRINGVALSSLNLSIRGGEICAILGIKENGLDVLEQTLTEINSEYTGDIITGTPPGEAQGFPIVPSKRTELGVNLQGTVFENLLFRVAPKDSKGGNTPLVFRKNDLVPKMRPYMSLLNVNGTIETKLSRLSGGNIQKLLLSRELIPPVPFLLLSEPGWGLDFSARNALFSLLRKKAAQGTGILLLSGDLDEVLETADTIGVLFNGVLSPLFPSRSVSRESLGEMMLEGNSAAAPGNRGTG